MAPQPTGPAGGRYPPGPTLFLLLIAYWWPTRYDWLPIDCLLTFPPIIQLHKRAEPELMAAATSWALRGLPVPAPLRTSQRARGSCT